MPSFLMKIEIFANIPQGKNGTTKRVALYFFLVGSLVFCVYSAIFAYLEMWHLTVVNAMSVLCVLISICFMRKDKIRAAIYLSCLSSYLTVLYNAYWMGGAFNYSDYFLLPVTIVAWFVLGYREGVAFALLSMIGTLTIYVLSSINGSLFILPIEYGGDAHGLMVLSMRLSLTITVLIMIYIFNHMIKKALHEIEIHNANMEAVLSSDIETATVIYGRDLMPINGTTSNYFRKLFGSNKELLDVLKTCDIKSSGALHDTLKSVIGENELTWDINTGNLPDSIKIRGMIHHAEWRPIYHGGVVDRIILSAHNVDALIKMQAEAAEKSEEAMLLLHLVSLGSVKVVSFIERAKIMMDDFVRLTNAKDHRHGYVILHTLKGAARTLEFSNLADCLHKMESNIENIDDNDVALSRSILAKIDCLVNSLGYSSDRISVSKSDALKAIVEGQCEEYLMDLTKTTLESLVASFSFDVSKISKSLEKPDTSIVYTQEERKIYLEADVKLALEQCFIHIIRNAMDHGIENREERVQTGKNARAKISFDASVEGEYVELNISDDGRGLNIEKIKMKAEKLGLESANKTNYEIAKIIFLPQFSTSETVSQVSGRGVGMDAIMSAMQEIGGKCDISLHSENMITPWTLKLRFPTSKTTIIK